MKDDNDFNPFLNTLEDFLANEKTQSKKRARVKDIEDKDDPVKIVSIASSAFNHTISTGKASKWPARPRNSKKYIRSLRSFIGKQSGSTTNEKSKAFSYIPTNP